jgi:opacity protein-like surface antigen
MGASMSACIGADQAIAKSRQLAITPGPLGRVMGAAGGIALVMSLFAATSAQAQNCTLATTSGAVSNVAQAGSTPAAVAGMIASSITATSTAFLLQSEAFIGAPPNPAPNQQGGGIWVRGVGGQVNIESSSVSPVAVSPQAGGAPLGTGTVSCSQKVDTDFAGVQFGADIAKLNVNGWNFHVGTTAGALSSNSTLVGGAFSFIDVTGLPAGGGPFTSTTQVPFFGAYAAATNGGFFIDGLLREEYYQTSLNAPGDLLLGQTLDAHGVTFSGSTGYNWAVPNSNWFIEPSASISISDTKVDPLAFTTAGTPGFTQFPGTLQLNDIRSDIGRVGVRVGETINGGTIVWQPFAAISVWHEFGPNITGNYATEPNCCFVGPIAVTGTGTGSMTTIGTFGQYSLGVSAAVPGTGWLGFARVDYRDGSDLQGLSGTGGIRYQFTPTATAGVMPVKAPVFKAPVVTAVDWTGFYIGGFGGAALGRADWKYYGLTTGEANPYVGGIEGGGDIGYNWQRDRWVVGVQGSLEALDGRGGVACNPGVPISGAPSPAVFLLTTCNAVDHWIGTATARLGYTWERALFYVKGGGAWTNERFYTSCNNGPGTVLGLNCTNQFGVNTTGATGSVSVGGWTIGYGSEYALTSTWSAVAETDYTSFADRNVTMSDGSVISGGLHFWETKVGLNYRFNPSAPLAMLSK